MKIKLIVGLITVCSYALMHDLSSQSTLELHQILDRHTEAMGGKNLWNNLHTYALYQHRANGAQVVNYIRKPDEYKILHHIDDRQRIKSFDGHEGFISINGSYEAMRPGEEIEMREEPEFYEELLFARDSAHYTLARLEDEQVDDRTCYVIQLIKSVSDTQLYWIDQSTYLIYQTGEFSEDPAHADIYYKTKFFQFEKVGEYWFPFHLQLIANDDRVFNLRYDSIQINQEYPETFFSFHPTTTKGYYAYLKDQFHHRRMDGLTFDQKTITFNSDGHPLDTSIWHEAVRYPDKFRIDIPQETHTRKILWRSDSVYVLRQHHNVDAGREYQASLLLKQGCFHYVPEELEWRLDSIGIDLSIFTPSQWQGQRIYIVGSYAETLNVPQAWYDAKHHRLIRRLSYTRNGGLLDVQYSNFHMIGGHNVEGSVNIFIDGTLRQSETYLNIHIDPAPHPKYFHPVRFKTNKWYD